MLQKDEAVITITTIVGMDVQKEFRLKLHIKRLLDYFDEVSVKPEIEKLYLEVMKTVFQANESSREQDISKFKENLTSAEKKLASLEEKYVLSEIERDSYALMKPRFKEEISKLKEKLSDLESKETNYTRYLNSGINLLQNLREYLRSCECPQ